MWFNSKREIVVVLRLARATSRGSWSLCVHPFLRLGGGRSVNAPRTGPVLVRAPSERDSGRINAATATVVVLSGGDFVNRDVELNHLKIPACETPLEVSAQRRSRLLVITIRRDGGHDGAFITFGVTHEAHATPADAEEPFQA